MSDMIREFSSSQIEVPEENMKLWQDLVDLMAETLEVPAGLIMRVRDDEIQVFVTSRNEDNPYTVGDSERLLNSGLYCETVLLSRQALIVPDALDDSRWDHNPDIKLGMVFYMGYPITAPDGSLFGTLCVLDTRKTEPSETYKKLMIKFRDIIESDLLILTRNKELRDAKSELEKSISAYECLSRDFAEKEEHIRAIGDNLPSALIFQLMVTPEGEKRFTYLSSGVEQLHECTPEEVLEDDSLLFGRVHEEDIEGLQRATEKSIAEMSVYDHRVRIIRKSGEVRWHRMISRPKRLDDGIIVFNGIDLDITEQKSVEDSREHLIHELRERNKELDCLHSISSLLGKPGISLDEICRKTVNIVKRGMHYPEFACVLILCDNEEYCTSNFRETRWCLSSGISANGADAGLLEVCYLKELPKSDHGPFLEEEKNLIIAVSDNLGKSIEYHRAQVDLEEKNALLEQKVTHDCLTELPNRILLYDRLNESIALCKRTDSRFAVCMADVDKLKLINDTFGHLIGDLALKEIAARAKSTLREHDTVARVGGDEFSLLILNIKDNAEVDAIVERLMETVSRPILVDGESIQASLSLGIAVYPSDGGSSDELLGNADKAMYECKNKGRNCYCFFEG
jgi:diguanylate cyclase (GGDEF)-like protein/PAS domain S-box-containing protein